MNKARSSIQYLSTSPQGALYGLMFNKLVFGRLGWVFTCMAQEHRNTYDYYSPAAILCMQELIPPIKVYFRQTAWLASIATSSFTHCIIYIYV